MTSFYSVQHHATLSTSKDLTAWPGMVVGLGTAGFFPVTEAFIADNFEPHERGRAYGIFGWAFMQVGPDSFFSPQLGLSVTLWTVCMCVFLWPGVLDRIFWWWMAGGAHWVARHVRTCRGATVSTRCLFPPDRAEPTRRQAKTFCSS